ncbi:flavodoxin [Vibrio algarum]|uniref:Flavodoxin n=1 Tax=Vibrio algarum TaxID=3020714 RepID=A0ABT4YXG7_9VIBR|nr:flavodoxin [Vibrio sp. KJ40-1]MDB1126198.1 flavodoxin [Vibrio sp. KJ40-1]
MISKIELVEKKHRWLLAQVDVDFPTPESILGRDLYIEREKSTQYRELASLNTEHQIESVLDEVYLVDFHRLTIMFAQLQSKFWLETKEQNHVLEFFAQIVLSESHDLYVGFKSTHAIICGIATRSNQELLISDLISEDANPIAIDHFINSIVKRYVKQESISKVIVPIA